MSNLESAKAAIQAELAHTKAGLAYYTARIEALEKTLLQLSDIGVGAVASLKKTIPVPAKRGPKAGAVKPAKKFKAAKGGGNELPFTGKDFWPNLVTDQPKSASDILADAIAALGFTPTKEQVKKLSGRMIFAINALVRAGTIKDSGKGRERRFFKA